MKQKTIAILEIDNEGNIHGLYTDEIDLFAIGRVVNVQKASNVEFNEAEQVWEVSSLDGDILHKNASRQEAIEWEIENFSVGRRYYHG